MHTTRHPAGFTAVLLALALALVLSACAEDDPALDVEPDDDTSDVDDGADDELDDDAASAAVALELGDTDVGEHLVDGDGNALYLFTPDEQGDSTCYDECEENWPPLTADGDADVGEGLDADLVGTTTRDDGAEQVTYNDWPLYHFAGDEAPGDVNGQGVNDVWFVVDAAGEMIEG